MRAIFCKSLVGRLKPAEKPYEVRDTRTLGLLIRVQPSGVMTYYLQVARGRRIKIGPVSISIEDVRVVATEHLASLTKGKDPVRLQIETGSHTFLSFIEKEYGPWANTHRATAPELIQRLKNNCKTFQRRRLAHITAALFEKWRTQRLAKGKSHQTVNRDLDDVRGVLSKAMQWGYISSNPLSKVRKFKLDCSRPVRFLSDVEEKRLFERLTARELAVRQARLRTNVWRMARGYGLLPTLHNHVFADPLRPMIVLALNTGIRRAELFDLQWEDVNMAQKFITVRGEKAKSYQTRHIPLNSVAWKCLNDWRAQCTEDTGFVFPSRTGRRLKTVQTAWKAVLAKAEVLGFRWHDMRHTFASRLVMKGVDLNTVRELLGHADCQMTLRYTHLAPEYKAEAVARLAA